MRVMQQLPLFRSHEGIFARPLVKKSAQSMPAHKWWAQFGGGVPELQNVAVKVLSQTTASSFAERNWSTYDFIHSKKSKSADSRQLEQRN